MPIDGSTPRLTINSSPLVLKITAITAAAEFKKK
jgi:hypothetical protein